MRKSRSIVDVGGGVSHKLHHRHKGGATGGENGRTADAAKALLAAQQQARVPYLQPQGPEPGAVRGGLGAAADGGFYGGGLSARVATNQ